LLILSEAPSLTTWPEHGDVFEPFGIFFFVLVFLVKLESLKGFLVFVLRLSQLFDLIIQIVSLSIDHQVLLLWTTWDLKDLFAYYLRVLLEISEGYRL